MRHPAHAPSGAPPAAKNGILCGVSPDELRLLEPLEHVRLPARFVALEAAAPVRHIYFPAGALFSFVHLDARGSMIEVAHVEAHGLVGVNAILGHEHGRHRAVVRIGGDAYRVPLASARAAFAHGKSFQALTLAFAERLLLQLSQHVICKLSHTVEQQFCRRLLHYADHARRPLIEITHEQIAEALGARRQGVTEAARRLQTRQAIAYRRGRIAVLDRPALEQYACECYRILRSAQPAESCAAG